MTIRANRQLDERARFGLGVDTQDDESTDLGVEAVVEDEVDAFATTAAVTAAVGPYDASEAPANVPLTSPEVQDVIDALVLLGLVEQSDPE
jgi:hypothetical protein